MPKHSLRVLFVDDEQAVAMIMQNELPRMGHEVTICSDGDEAVAALNAESFDAALIDLRMPGIDGWGVIDHLKRVAPDTEFVIHAGHGNMDDVLRALRAGAYDFLPKPCKLFEIDNVLQRIGDKQKLARKAIALEQRLKSVEGGTELIGESPAMQRVRELIHLVAPTDTTVLILGETGTGKELAARQIHVQSPRSSEPFVAINCGALPENLAESEFFGHRKGAFTGADESRVGLVEVANGGTLFLDELGELDKTMQVKLLRFLESGEIRRVGENEPAKVDVRIVCATNRDLAQMVSDGTFREDLHFRLNMFEIRIPPLRERKADIPLLAKTLLQRHMKRPAIPSGRVNDDVLRVLADHQWNGNVRELSNVLERALILAQGGRIQPAHIQTGVTVDKPPTQSDDCQIPLCSLAETEALQIQRALQKCNGNRNEAAAMLGVTQRTLYNKLKKLNQR